MIRPAGPVSPYIWPYKSRWTYKSKYKDLQGLQGLYRPLTGAISQLASSISASKPGECCSGTSPEAIPGPQRGAPGLATPAPAPGPAPPGPGEVSLLCHRVRLVPLTTVRMDRYSQVFVCFVQNAVPQICISIATKLSTTIPKMRTNLWAIAAFHRPPIARRWSLVVGR